MKRELNLEQIIDILIKREFGSLTEEEQALFYRWLEESDENKELLKRLEKRELLIEFYNKLGPIDSQKAKREMEKMLRVSTLRKRLYRFSIWSVGVASLFVLAFYLFQGVKKSSTETVESVTAYADIKPVEKKAKLILEDGQEINLENLQEAIVKEGLTTINIDSNSLNYKIESLDYLPQETIYNTLLIPKGGEYLLTLSDGTKVWMNADSRLRYPVVFNDDVRTVHLEGEAYFEVFEDPSKPFVVSTNAGDITVLGTSFNVKNYWDDELMYATLVNGSISFQDIKGESTTLKPGQQLSYNSQLGTRRVQNVNVNNYVSWKDNALLFENLSFEEIMKTLARWYDVNVTFESDEIKELKFSGSLDKYKDIDIFIRLFEAQANIKFTVHEKNISINKKML